MVNYFYFNLSDVGSFNISDPIKSAFCSTSNADIATKSSSLETSESGIFFRFFRNRQKSGVAAAVVDVVVVVAAAVVVAVVVAVADAADGEVTQKKPRKFEQHGSDFSSGKNGAGSEMSGISFHSAFFFSLSF